MISTFAALLLAAQPGPALLAIGSCAAGRTSAADRQSVTTSLQDGSPPSAGLIERIGGHVVSCTPANGAASGDAMVAAATYISRDEMARQLSRAGVDPKLVDRWFARQSEAVKTGLELTEEQGEAWGRALIAEGAPETAVHANPQPLGSYIASLIVLERLGRGLPGTE